MVGVASMVGVTHLAPLPCTLAAPTAGSRACSGPVCKLQGIRVAVQRRGHTSVGPRQFQRTSPLRSVATAPDASGSLSGSLDELDVAQDPASPHTHLTLHDLKLLGQGRNGEVYEGGVVNSPRALARALGTSLHSGLTEDEAGLAARTQRYGSNAFPKQDSVSFLELAVEALQVRRCPREGCQGIGPLPAQLQRSLPSTPSFDTPCKRFERLPLPPFCRTSRC